MNRNEGCFFRLIKFIILILIIILLISCIHNIRGVDSFNIPWTDKQIVLHEAADLLREAGYSDDSEIIQSLSNEWWAERNNLQMVAKTIFKEAGGCTWDHMVYVGAVIMNRLRSDKFPDTIYDILVAPRQYSESYTYDFNDIPEICYKAAVVALNEEDDAPEDLYWQAQFPQGREVWKIFEVDTGYYQSTTYFCRGAYGE